MTHLRLLSYSAIILLSSSLLSAHEWKMWGSLQQQRAFGYVAPVSATAAIVVGGFPDFVYGSQHFGSRVTRSCEILDVLTGEVRYTDSTAVPHADGPMVRMSNGHIVVLGGVTDGQQGITTVVESFDPLTEKWTTLGNLLLPRRQQQAVALDENRIMIACGRDASLSGTQNIEIFDVTTGVCTLIKDYPHGLTNHKLMMMDSVVYLIGGRASGPHSSRFTDTYFYDETTDEWEFAFDLPVSMPLLEGIQVYGGMFTSGGSVNDADNQFSDVVYYINGGGATPLDGKLGTSVKGHCFAPWVSDSIISFGGENNEAGSATASSWINTLTSEVTAGPELNIGRRYGLSVALQGDSLVPACVLAISGVMTDKKVTPTIEILVSPVCEPQNIVAALTAPVLSTAGSARVTDTRSVMLTGQSSNTAGAVWYKHKVSLRSGLSTAFSFSLKKEEGTVEPSGNLGAESAIAFVIQNSSPTALGKSGLGRGYEDIPNALAIEFDLYDATTSDPSSTKVAVQSQRERKLKPWHRAGNAIGQTSSGAHLRADGTIYFAQIEFHGTNLDVYVDTTPIHSTPVLSIRGATVADMISLGLDGAAWLGITSAAGQNLQVNELLSWSVDGCNSRVAAPVTVEDDKNVAAPADQPSIYPMPSSDNALLRCAGVKSLSVINVYNATGTRVWTRDALATELAQGVQIPAIDFATGMYVVQIMQPSGVLTIPWIIQR